MSTETRARRRGGASRATAGLLLVLLASRVTAAADDTAAAAPWHAARWPAGRVLGYTLEVRAGEEHAGASKAAALQARLALRVDERGDVSLALTSLALSRPDQRLAWSFGPLGVAHDGSEHALALEPLVGEELPVAPGEAGAPPTFAPPASAAATLLAAGLSPDLLAAALGAPLQGAPDEPPSTAAAWAWHCTLATPLAGVAPVTVVHEARPAGVWDEVVTIALRATAGDAEGADSTGTLLWHQGSRALLRLQLETTWRSDEPAGAAVTTRTVLALDPAVSSEPDLDLPLLDLGRIGERLERANVVSTMARMTMLQSALFSYRMEHGELPETLEQLVQPDTLNLGEPWLEDAGRLHDAWGRPFVYRRFGAREYALLSWGRDGRSGGRGPDADLTNER